MHQDDHALLAATKRRMPKYSGRTVATLLAGLMSTIAVSSYSAFRIHVNERDFQRIQRDRLADSATKVLNNVQRQLETSVSSVKALAALVQLDQGSALMNPLAAQVQDLIAATANFASKASASQAEKDEAKGRKQHAAQNVFTNATLFSFNRVAQSLISTYKGISNLQLAPGGVVSVIHPIIGHEAAIGHDLFYDASRRDGAIKSITSQQVTFVGPLTLIQTGEHAIIARFPVFIDTYGYRGLVQAYPTWWGFTTMLCTLDDFFRDTALAIASYHHHSYVLYAATATGNQILRKSDDVPRDWEQFADSMSPIFTEFRVQELNVHWCMKSWPKSGWQWHSDIFGLQVVLCICFGILSLMSLYGAVLRASVIREVNSLVLKSISSKQVPNAEEVALSIVPQPQREAWKEVFSCEAGWVHLARGYDSMPAKNFMLNIASGNAGPKDRF